MSWDSVPFRGLEVHCAGTPAITLTQTHIHAQTTASSCMPQAGMVASDSRGSSCVAVVINMAFNIVRMACDVVASYVWAPDAVGERRCRCVFDLPIRFEVLLVMVFPGSTQGAVGQRLCRFSSFLRARFSSQTTYRNRCAATRLCSLLSWGPHHLQLHMSVHRVHRHFVRQAGPCGLARQVGPSCVWRLSSWRAFSPTTSGSWIPDALAPAEK